MHHNTRLTSQWQKKAGKGGGSGGGWRGHHFGGSHLAGMLMGGSAFMFYNIVKPFNTTAEAAEPNEQDKKDEDEKTFFERNVLDYKSLAKD